MTKRQKASDVYREANHFFGEKTATFAQTFPQIEKMSVTVVEEGDGAYVSYGDNKKRHHFSETSPPGPYLDCSNPRCYNGGFALKDIIMMMVTSGDTEHETTVWCQGYEGTPKGRKNYGPCENRFEITAKITYKEAEEDQTKEE